MSQRNHIISKILVIFLVSVYAAWAAVLCFIQPIILVAYIPIMGYISYRHIKDVWKDYKKLRRRLSPERPKWMKLNDPPKDNRNALLGYSLTRVDTLPLVFYENGVWYYVDFGGCTPVPEDILKKFTHWLYITLPTNED
jgi:hypothetical protein